MEANSGKDMDKREAYISLTTLSGKCDGEI